MLPSPTHRVIKHLIFSALLLLGFSLSASAQVPKNNSLPRVGTVKDYPATGLMSGCGNLYFYKTSQAKSMEPNYVFLSRGDGGNAWMNLNGGDVRLRQMKSRARGNQKFRSFIYRFGNVRITISIEDFKDAAGSDPMYKMRISLRNGRARRIVHAIGDADC